jgi:hypothetical protein
MLLIFIEVTMVSEDLVKLLVGMTEAAAHETCASALHSCEILVTRRDEEVFMSDMMMNDNRVKVEIEKNLVVTAIAG